MVGVARPTAAPHNSPLSLIRRRRTRLLRIALSATALLGVVALPAAARADGVVLQTAIANGMQKADHIAGFGYSGPAGQNPFCTPEPKHLFWGTQNFIPANNLSSYGNKVPGDPNYVPPNLPSASDLATTQVAGSHSDFCMGFTLTPNADPAIVRSASHASGFRILTSPAIPDTPDTRVADDANQPVEGDDMQRIVFDLPAGYVGALASVDTCDADTAFGRFNWAPVSCDASTQVGDAYIRINDFIRRALRIHLPLAGSPVYNLSHGPDELGVLGVVVNPVAGVAPVKFTIRLTFVPDGSGQIRAIVEDAPTESYSLSDVGQVGATWRDGSGDVLADGDPRVGALQPDADPYPLYIESVGFRIWGSKADHPTMKGDFGELGSQCSQDVKAHVDVTTYNDVHSAIDSPPIRYTGCDQLDFRPSVDVTTTEHSPGVPTGVTFTVNLGQNGTGSRTTALLKDASIKLPIGLELGAQVASVEGGLRLCQASEFAYADKSTPAACKDGSAVGTVHITSPLIDYPFVGTVYLGEQRAVGELPDLYVEASPENASAPDAPRVKLLAHVSADPVTGQLTTDFPNNPQLRFSQIVFDFPTGPTSFFTTPERCGTYTGNSILSPWSGTAAVSSPSSITIDQDCDLPVSPNVDVSSANQLAGARSQTRITVDRPDRGPWLTHLNIALPTGLLADLNIPTECAADQAAAGACPQSARLGTVTALAGAGTQPWNLAGAMYLTSRKDGDVAGVVIVVRAAVGDLDLGNVIVPGTIKLRPTDAGLTFDSEVPTRFRGVALQLRKVIVDMDRANLTMNPTSCGPVTSMSHVTSDGGTVSDIARDMTFVDCEKLPFHPTLNAQITGDNTPGGHPGMYVRLESPEGDSALKSAAVTLPEGVAVDLDNVQNTCSQAQFDAVQCPAAARVGSVTARVSITSEPITGDIYLLKVKGKTLPGLGLNFTGRFAQRVTSYTELDAKKRIVVTFPEIPDLPLRELIVQVDSTKRSPLQLPKTACANGTNWNGAFIGQGGQKTVAATGLQCAAKASVRLSERRGLTLRLFDFGGRKLASLKVTLPSGWVIKRRSALRRADQMWVRMSGGSPKVTLSDTSLTALSRTKTASTIRLKLGGAVIRAATPAARKAKRGRLRIRIVFTDGTVQVQRPALTLKK